MLLINQVYFTLLILLNNNFNKGNKNCFNILPFVISEVSNDWLTETECRLSQSLLDSCPILYHHLCFIHALKGNQSESNNAYRHYIDR